jgi:hypothetical protein
LHVFHPVGSADLPDRFTHDTLDDRGHRFSFFWAPLARPPAIDMHPVFLRALTRTRQHVDEDANSAVDPLT